MLHQSARFRICTSRNDSVLWHLIYFFSSQRAKLAFLGVSELKTSKRWLTILEIVLTIGNTLNEGTVFGNAGGFRIDSLLKV